MRHSHGLRAAAGAEAVAIEFVASAQTQTPSATATLVIDKPTGTQQGDLLVALACEDGAVGTWTQPTNWNEVLDQGSGTAIMVSHYIAGASEPSDYTFTFSAGRRLSGIILAYRNAAYDVVGSVSTTASSGVQTAPAITLTQARSTVLAFFVNATANRTWSSPTSGLISLATDSDGNAPSWDLYSESNVAAGSTGGKSATCSAAVGTFGCVLAGIKPS